MFDDDVFMALADSYRRRLLVQLLDSQRCPVAAPAGRTRDLAEAHGGLLQTHLDSGRHVPGADEDLLRARHVHLPKLAACDFVEWDRDGEFVRKGDRFDEVRPALELLADRVSADPIRV
jgi:hypothetical protein